MDQMNMEMPAAARDAGNPPVEGKCNTIVLAFKQIL